MHGASRILTCTFLVLASVYSASGNGAVNTIRIGGGDQGGSEDGDSIRIGDNRMKITGPATIVVCNAKGAHTNSSIKPQSSGSGGPADLGEGLGAIFGLMEGFAKVAEGLDESLNNPDGPINAQPDNPLGGLFGLLGGLAKVAEGLDESLNNKNGSGNAQPDLGSLLDSLSELDDALSAPDDDECSDKKKKKCTKKGGRCQSSSSCNGKVIPNGCEGSCTCCAPPPCNKADGFFKIQDQCFKAYNEESTYFDEAETICQNDGLVVAEPSEDIAPKLQKYLKKTYGGMFSSYWLNGRGTGDYSIIWQRSGSEVASTNSRLWWPDEPNDDEYTTDHCVYMTVWDHALEAHPGRPFLSGGCSWKPHIPLCERIDYV